MGPVRIFRGALSVDVPGVRTMAAGAETLNKLRAHKFILLFYFFVLYKGVSLGEVQTGSQLAAG